MKFAVPPDGGGVGVGVGVGGGGVERVTVKLNVELVEVPAPQVACETTTHWYEDAMREAEHDVVPGLLSVSQ